MLTNNIDTIKKQIKNAVNSAVEEIGISGTAQLQANSPVLSGTLKRSLTYKKANKSNKYTVTFGTALDYAPYTEFRNKTKGWMRNSVNGLSGEAIQILIKHLGKVGK